MFDAEGSFEGVPCPECGSEATVSWHFAEGFDELECRHCGYRSDEADLAELERDAGDVLLQDASDAPPLRKKPLRA
ncbi:MAG: hypothetical protein ACOCUN_03385 [Jiangellaceae bacterium]